MNNQKIKGIVYLLITAIIWGGSFISQLFGGKIIGSFSFSAYRGIIGSFTISILILLNNKNKFGSYVFFRDNEDVNLTIKNSFICGITLFLALITQQIGVEITDTAKSGLIASLEVICVPILMLIIYNRKIKLITWLFIFTAMLGIMMLSLNSISGFNIGDFWVFLSTIIYSITIIQVPKYVKNIDPLKFSFFRFVVVAIFSLLFSFIFKEKAFEISKIKSALPSILYSGILASGVAYTLQIIGQQICEPVIATLIMSLEGVFAAIFGWIILGQVLNILQIFGILVAFLSIVMVQLTDY